jgi:hypothetical protein
MFSIFRRPSKIHIDCFTYIPGLIDLFPVQNAVDRIPNWFKTVPTTCKSPTGPMKGTMKTCPGVGDLVKTGIILQAWCDIYVDWSRPGNNGLFWEPADKGETHNPLQWNNTPALSDFFHFKFLSPWKFVEKTGVQFMMMNTFWHDPKQRHVTPAGILDYKYQHTTNINMFIPKNVFPQTLTIHAGTPVSHIIPLSDKSIVLHQHEVTEQEYIRKYMGFPFTFNASYYKKKKILESKCPV